MALKMTTALRNSMLAAINTAAGAGGNLKIYAGTQPTDANTAIGAQTLLVTLPIATSFQSTAPAAGLLTLTVPTTTAVSAAGSNTASFFRMTNAVDNTTLFDGTVGVTGADLNMSTVTFVNSANISITSFTITAGNP